MTIQENVGVLVTYAVESAFGTAPSGGGSSQRLRRTTSGLNIEKDAFASQEVRPDQQVATYRHGGHRVNGPIAGELSTVTYDDFLEALLRGAWATGASKSNTELGTCTISSGVATFGTGNPITEGFKVGDIVRFANLSVAGNNNINLRVTALTSTTMTLIKSDGTAPADNASDAAYTLVVVGKKLTMGTTKRSYTIEHSYPEIDIAELFTGCRIAGASIRVPPNGIASVDFQIMGKKGEVLTGGSAPYFTAATAAGASDVLTGIEGGIRVNGAEQSVITGIDLSISGNFSATPVIGTPYVPNIFPGRLMVQGNVSFYLEDSSLLSAFVNESEVDILAVLSAAAVGSSPPEFLTLNMQRVKLGAASKQLQAEGGVIVQSPFMAILKTGGSGTAYDQSTLTIQRSNS